MLEESVTPVGSVRFASVRPLVRYADAQQAVVEVHVGVEQIPDPRLPDALPLTSCVLRTELRGEDGFEDEQDNVLTLVDGQGMVRLHIVEPQLWWPAALGEQPMYRLKVKLVVDDEVVDERESALGLTSVRCRTPLLGRSILVNGCEVEIGQVVPVDLADERHLLPAAGDSLLLVRGHYGPDVLYHAADRAGILMLQCIPIHPLAKPANEVHAHVDRLAAHPSLIGWFVGHLGALADDVARVLKRLDPTHGIYRNVAA